LRTRRMHSAQGPIDSFDPRKIDANPAEGSMEQGWFHERGKMGI